MSTFNPPADIAQITLAKSSDVNAVKSATAIAFGLLPSETKLQRGTVNFAVDTGTANTYVVALDASITAYTDGLQVVFRPLNDNTGSATINLNSLGAKSIRLTDSEAIQAGDISAGAVIDVRYSTATGFFHLTPNSAIYAHDAGVSADAAAASAVASAGSASDALSYKNTAEGYKNTASASAAAAGSSATASALSASDSLSYRNAAEGYKNTAGDSATAASSSAVASAGSASDALSYRNAAEGYKNTAEGYKNTASASATAAGSSATSAAAAYDSFDDRYLGSKASDPTLDNDGNALLTGALYWNSTSSVMKAWSGSSWIAGANSFSADLSVNGLRIGRGVSNDSNSVSVNSPMGNAANSTKTSTLGQGVFTYAVDIADSVGIGYSAGVWMGGYSAFAISAGSFIVGKKYKIVTVGTTDFVAIGATSNTVGVTFTATGVGSGTGKASGICDKITLVGSNAMAGFEGYPYSNSTAIGYGANFTADNQIQLGNSATTTYVYGTVQNRSDLRDKADVQDTILGLAFIKALRPVDFKWDMREYYKPLIPITIEYPENATNEEKKIIDAKNKINYEDYLNESNLLNITRNGTKKRIRFHHGLIAQEVKAIIEETKVDFGGFQDHSMSGGGEIMSLGYDEFIAPLIKAIQELSADFESYKNTHP